MLIVGQVVVAPDRLDALLVAVAAFEGAVDDSALADASVAVLRAAGHVIHEVEGPEALSRLRRSPNHGETRIGNDAFD